MSAVDRHEERLRRLFRQILVGSLATPLGTAAVAAGACNAEPAQSADAPDACAPVVTEIDAQVSYCTVEQAPYCEAGSRCESFLRLPCGPPAPLHPRPSCYLSPNDCAALCPGSPFTCIAVGDWCEDGGLSLDRGPAVVECEYCLNASGRRPRGLIDASTVVTEDAVGAYLARASHLEAASVHAFRALARELSHHGAPRALVDGARRAARDEIAHARVTARLARARGASPPRVEVRAAQARTLGELATENAVEGCVRETFGALVASYQAEHARDDDVAAAMRVIAADELRHAALAWAIAEWADGRLDAGERASASCAATNAVAQLTTEVASAAPSAELVARAGLPPRSIARDMLRALEPAPGEWPISSMHRRDRGRHARIGLPPMKPPVPS